MPTPNDPIRAYQLPENSPAQLYLSLYNLASNAPVYITPGFGGNGGNQLPPLITGAGHWDETVTTYCEQANVSESPNDDDKGKRTAHVKRIFAGGTPGGGGAVARDTAGPSLDTEMYVDVLRWDKLPVVFRSYDDGQTEQTITYKMLWNDDPSNPLQNVDASRADSQGEDANAVRKTHQKAIINPTDPDNPTPVKVFVIDSAKIKFQTDTDTGIQGQIIKLTFLNTVQGAAGDPNAPSQRVAKRKVTAIKVPQNDLKGLTMSDSDGRNPRIVDWETVYKPALQSGGKDTSQQIDVEVTLQYTHVFQTDTKYPFGGGKVNQEVIFALGHNRKVAELYDAGNPDAADKNGRPCIVRMDPLSTIVNVGFGGLAVIFGPNHQDAPKFQAPAALKEKLNVLATDALMSAG